MEEDKQIEQESIILENSVIDVLSASDLLIHLVARLINNQDVKDDDTKYNLQKAYTLLSRGKKGLKKIGFIQDVH